MQRVEIRTIRGGRGIVKIVHQVINENPKDTVNLFGSKFLWCVVVFVEKLLQTGHYHRRVVDGKRMVKSRGIKDRDILIRTGKMKPVIRISSVWVVIRIWCVRSNENGLMRRDGVTGIRKMKVSLCAGDKKYIAVKTA